MARLKIVLTFFGVLVLFSIFLIVINDADDPVSFKSLFSPISFDNIRVASITETSAIIVGSTSKAVHCTVEYGTNEQFTKTASDSDMMNMVHTEHLITITDLEPSTTYDYRFKVTFEGEDYYSKTKSFVTSPKAGPQSELTEKHLILPGSRIGNIIQPFD